MQRRQTWLAWVGAVAFWGASAPAQAQEAATGHEPPAGQTTATTGAGAEGASAAPSDDVGVRIGRAEMVLVENDDPESALEFGLEVTDAGPRQPRLFLLLGTCQLRLQRYDEAADFFQRAARATAESDPQLHLHALYGHARVLLAAGNVAQAAAAYEQYATYARSHSDLASHPEQAEALSATLQSRARAEQPSR